MSDCAYLAISGENGVDQEVVSEGTRAHGVARPALPAKGTD